MRAAIDSIRRGLAHASRDSVRGRSLVAPAFRDDDRDEEAAVPLGMRIVAAEVAHVTARRHVGIVTIPEFMDQPVVERSKELGLRPKMVAQIARNVEGNLRRLTKTPLHGGVQPLPQFLDDGRRVLQDSESQLAAAQLEAVGMRVGAPREALRALSRRHGPPGAPPEEVREAALALAPTFDAKQSLAYAATRLPAVYACLVRVFDELQFRLPEFRPARVLDYGSGPGTVMWALQKVWGSDVQHVTAVEGRAAMIEMSLRIQSALQQADSLSWTSNVRWLTALPKARGAGPGRAAPDRRRYGLVVAAHALTGLVDRRERMALVRALWERTDDMLVLLEPGTPLGSVAVREARAQVLQEDNKRSVQLARALKEVQAAQQYLAAAQPAAGSIVPSVSAAVAGSGGLELSRKLADLQQKVERLRVEASGAHVVAPCAHDGVCPMDHSESRSWCHFRQRFNRTHLHRMCKIRKGADNMPRGWQYERFSYVVLRRGARGPSGPEVFIEPGFKLFQEEESWEAANLPPKLLQALRQGGEVDPLEVFPFLRTDGAYDEGRDRADDVGGAQQAAAPGGEGDEDAAELDPAELELERAQRQEAQAFLDEYLASVAALRDIPGALAAQSTRFQRGSASILNAERPPTSEAHAGVPESAQPPHPRTVPPGSGGDVDSNAAAGDGDFCSAESAAQGGPPPPARGVGDASQAPPHRLEQSESAFNNQPGCDGGTHAQTDSQPYMHLGRANDTAQARIADAALVQRADSRLESSPAEKGIDGDGRPGDLASEDLWMRGRDWSVEDPEGVAACRAALPGWSRIIRKPLKLGRHVILDVCVATGDQKSGALERHIVSRSDRRRPWMGPSAYRLSRRAEWGDLWPSIYHRNHRVRPCR